MSPDSARANPVSCRAAPSPTFVFCWGGHEPSFCSPGLPNLLAGEYAGRIPLDVWREDKVIHPDDAPALTSCLSAMERGIAYMEGRFRLRCRHGGYVQCVCTFTLVNAAGRHIGTLRPEEGIGHGNALADSGCRDTLTGALAPRVFFERADALLAEGGPHCILRFSAEELKHINQTRGLDAGDHFLRVLARHVRSLLHPGHELLARMDGESFAVCLMGGLDQGLHFVRTLARLWDNPQKHRRAGLHFGICQALSAEVPAHVLCDRAGFAQRTVRNSSVRNVAIYDDRLRQRQDNSNYITAHMAGALEQGQFRLFLQPKVFISTGRVVGAEALTRWQHPVDGMIMPDRFVPLFEANGFILRLDTYIWEQTCRALRHWLDKGFDAVPVSVNVSRLHFTQAGLLEQLVSLTDRYGLPRRFLELEITETAFLSRENELQRQMRELHAVGFSLSMDDFGIGYSSLNTLRDLPFNTVKLDKVFVQGESVNDRGRVVARSTIALAQKLGLRVVAEGVETQEQARFLLENGCDCAQGFLYARPMEAHVFEEHYLTRRETFPVYTS